MLREASSSVPLYETEFYRERSRFCKDFYYFKAILLNVTMSLFGHSNHNL